MEYLLFIIILLLIIYYNKKKLKIFFTKNNILTKKIEDIDSIFLPDQIKNLKRPKDSTYIKYFCVPTSFEVVGTVSDYESWILSVIAKKSKSIFEFGTCSGKTTLLFAMNSPSEAKITSITLKARQVEEHEFKISDNKYAIKNIKKESTYDNFMFSNTEYEKKIKIIFQDSLLFKVEQGYINTCDLIFIDGGHTYTCIKNDTEKALKMVKNEGVILWHDFVVGKTSSKDIVKYLNEISKDYKVFHIENTSLCYLKVIK